MKSFGTGLEEIAGPLALLDAWRRYRSGKRRRPAVAYFSLDAERRILDLSGRLLSSRYRPSAYQLLEIRDPKPRLIAVAEVGDRVVHRSIYDTLAHQFQRSFIDDSYACLPGRGSHRAIFRFLDCMRKHPYLLHLDIRHYFPSVDHQILLEQLQPRLRDSRVTALVQTILDSGAALYRRPQVQAFYGAPSDSRPRGLPIGNLTSQWWGNLYLNGLDHFAKRQLKAKAYLRYMDDIVCFADEQRTLRQWRREITGWLEEHRRLQINSRKGHIRSTGQPQTYLGYRMTRQGFDLGPKAVRRFRHRLPKRARGDRATLIRALIAWRAAMTF